MASYFLLCVYLYTVSSNWVLYKCAFIINFGLTVKEIKIWYN